MTVSYPDVLAPARLGPLRLRKRVIKAATFEGMTTGAVVSENLIDYHRRVSLGGVGMTTVAHLAVAPEGRTETNAWQPSTREHDTSSRRRRCPLDETRKDDT